MLRTLVDKIYQPTVVDPQRLLLLRIGLVGFLMILASSLLLHRAAQIANVGTMTVMGGLVASVIGLIIMLAGTVVFILST